MWKSRLSVKPCTALRSRRWKFFLFSPPHYQQSLPYNIYGDITTVYRVHNSFCLTPNRCPYFSCQPNTKVRIFPVFSADKPLQTQRKTAGSFADIRSGKRQEVSNCTQNRFFYRTERKKKEMRQKSEVFKRKSKG